MATRAASTTALLAPPNAPHAIRYQLPTFTASAIIGYIRAKISMVFSIFRIFLAQPSTLAVLKENKSRFLRKRPHRF